MSAPIQKITFAEMRESGIRGLLVYCADYRCSHSITISGDAWPDDLRLSDIEPRFVCQAYGQSRRRCAARLQLQHKADRDDGISVSVPRCGDLLHTHQRNISPTPAFVSRDGAPGPKL